MMLSFLNHQAKAFWRSTNLGQGIAVRIVMGVLIVYLLLNVLVISFFLEKILTSAFPAQDPVTSFRSLILYYFIFDLLARFQLQSLPTLSILPYLNLPVKRNQIINYLSIRSVLSVFNLVPFLLTIPFLIQVLLPSKGTVAFISFLVFFTGFVFFNHFFSLWLKRKVNLKISWLFGFFLLLLAAAFFDHRSESALLSSASLELFSVIERHPMLSVAGLLLAVVMWRINHSFMKANLYLDVLDDPKKHVSGTDIPFLHRFGLAGDLAANELKLIMRNKRSRSSVTLSVFFLLYGLIFYTKPAVGYFSIVFCGMFMTGIFIIQYGQFMFSWQSAHFDGILASRIHPAEFFKGKFLLFTIFATACFLLTIPYVYFGWRFVLIHFVMYIWNLGVNTLIVLYFACSNYSRIDLTKSSTFNWEGVGATQWILAIPLFLAPILVFWPFSLAGLEAVGLFVLGLIGLAFILTRGFWSNLLVSRFIHKRYDIASGFRTR